MGLVGGGESRWGLIGDLAEGVVTNGSYVGACCIGETLEAYVIGVSTIRKAPISACHGHSWAHATRARVHAAGVLHCIAGALLLASLRVAGIISGGVL